MDQTMDAVFLSLAHAGRRKILDIVQSMPGCSVNDVAKYFEMSRIGVMKHLKILVEADLLISRKEGRSRELYFNAAPIQMIHDRWTTEYAEFWATKAMDFKYKIEGVTKKKSDEPN